MADCPVCELHAESVFKIEGMDCHEEVAILEHRLKALTGLEALDADVVGQRLRIQYDAAKLTTSRIAEAVAQTGMRAWLEHEEPRPGLGVGLARAAGRCCRARSSPLAWRCSCGVRRPLAWLLPYVAAVVLAGTQTARRAWTSLIAGRLDIHVLMMVAVAGAIALGEWAEGASVVFLFALAQVLEARAMERARGAIRALMDLAPAEALVRRDGTERIARHRRGRGRRHRHRPAGREDSARRPRARRREPRQPGADHRRVAAGRQGAAATTCSAARSTAAARSTSR